MHSPAKIRRTFGVVALGGLTLLAGPRAILAQPVHATDCDRYAASDFDKQSLAPGVPFNKIDPTRAIPACEDAVAKEPNEVRLVYQLGRAYDANKDFAKALEFFRRAAAANFALAEVNLGSLYFNGQGVARDYKEAAKWDRLAADQGLAPAQANLGLMYIHGQGVEIDYLEGQRLLRLAADQNFAPALNALGDLYAEGTGVNQNYIEAAKLYRLAAEQGYAPGQTNLGALYAKGQGVPRSYVEAMRWYGLAADQGNSGAQASHHAQATSGASSRDQSLPAVETKPAPSRPAEPFKPAPNGRYVEAPAGTGYPPVRIIVKPPDNRTSGGAPIVAIDVAPISPDFSMASFAVNKGDCPVYVEDPSALLARGPGGAAPNSSQSVGEAQSEFAKISLTRPPFDPPIVAALGQYMTFYVDPSVCVVHEVEVLVNGLEWTWTPG
jgi:tetratricopeptide (TPR) repeat protein